MLSIWTSLKFCHLVKGWVIFTLLSAIAVNLGKSKIMSYGGGLTVRFIALTSLVTSYSTCLRIKPFFSGSSSTFTVSSSTNSGKEKHNTFGDFSRLILILAERRSAKSPIEGFGSSVK